MLILIFICCGSESGFQNDADPDHNIVKIAAVMCIWVHRQIRILPDPYIEPADPDPKLDPPV